jgi:hypothetical protein
LAHGWLHPASALADKSTIAAVDKAQEHQLQRSKRIMPNGRLENSEDPSRIVGNLSKLLPAWENRK